MPSANSLGIVNTGQAGPREIMRHPLSIAAAEPNTLAQRVWIPTQADKATAKDRAVCDCQECLVPCQSRRRLLMWNLLLALFHAGLAVATFLLGNLNLTVSLFYTVSNFTMRNESNPSAGWDLFPLYVEAPWGLPLTWLTASFFILSSLAHLLNATLLRNYYIAQLERCYTPTRWVEYFFSAPLVQLLVALSLGVRDRSLLIAMVVLIAITMPFGYWVEQMGRPATPTTWKRPLRQRLSPWFLGHVPQVAAWGLLIAQFYASDNRQRIPFFVHLILWAEFAFFFSFGVASLLGQLRAPEKFVQSEILFQILSLVSKGTLGLILIVNVLMLSSFDELYE